MDGLDCRRNSPAVCVRQVKGCRQSLTLLFALFCFLILPSCGSRRAETSDPKEADRQIESARRLVSAGKTYDALKALAKAKLADPKRTDIYGMRVRLFAQASQYRQALEESRAARKIAPNDPEIIISELQLGLGCVPAFESEELARLAVSRAPQAASAHLLLGRAIVLSGNDKRLPDALRAFQEANRLSPGAPDPLIEIGRVYDHLGDYRDSAAMLETAAKQLDAQVAGKTVAFGMLQQWIEARHMTAFLLAQTYAHMGRVAESRSAADVAAKWSGRSNELKKLSRRAASVPPDTAAENQMHEIEKRGLAYWQQ